MKIAIAIPTFNRVEYLRKAVQSVLDQVHDHGVELYIVISNIASTDGTGDYLDQLNKDQENVIVYNQPEDNRIYPNPYFLASVIPEDIDWVWFMGDDDYLMQENSVQIVSEHIKEHQEKDLCFLHACQGRTSRSTGLVRFAEIFDLCNEFGYHEILGWFSSIVLRKSEFVASMNELRETHHYMFQTRWKGDQIILHSPIPQRSTSNVWARRVCLSTYRLRSRRTGNQPKKRPSGGLSKIPQSAICLWRTICKN